jgi:hypothetical protein
MHMPICRSVARLAAAALLAVATLLVPGLAGAQQPYPSAEAAAQAFHDAVSGNDSAALRKVLGADWKRFLPTDAIGRTDLQAFLSAWDKAHKVVVTGQDQAVLAVGDGGWTLPIPLVMKGGTWRFDPRAGADEMRTRRWPISTHKRNMRSVTATAMVCCPTPASSPAPRGSATGCTGPTTHKARVRWGLVSVA